MSTKLDTYVVILDTTGYTMRNAHPSKRRSIRLEVYQNREFPVVEGVAEGERAVVEYGLPIGKGNPEEIALLRMRFGAVSKRSIPPWTLRKEQPVSMKHQTHRISTWSVRVCITIGLILTGLAPTATAQVRPQVDTCRTHCRSFTASPG